MTATAGADVTTPFVIPDSHDGITPPGDEHGLPGFGPLVNPGSSQP